MSTSAVRGGFSAPQERGVDLFAGMSTAKKAGIAVGSVFAGIAVMAVGLSVGAVVLSVGTVLLAAVVVVGVPVIALGGMGMGISATKRAVESFFAERAAAKREREAEMTRSFASSASSSSVGSSLPSTLRLVPGSGSDVSAPLTPLSPAPVSEISAPPVDQPVPQEVMAPVVPSAAAEVAAPPVVLPVAVEVAALNYEAATARAGAITRQVRLFKDHAEAAEAHADAAEAHADAAEADARAAKDADSEGAARHAAQARTHFLAAERHDESVDELIEDAEEFIGGGYITHNDQKIFDRANVASDRARAALGRARAARQDARRTAEEKAAALLPVVPRPVEEEVIVAPVLVAAEEVPAGVRDAPAPVVEREEPRQVQAGGELVVRPGIGEQIAETALRTAIGSVLVSGIGLYMGARGTAWAARNAFWAGRVVLVDTPVAALGVAGSAARATGRGAVWAGQTAWAGTAAAGQGAISATRATGQAVATGTAAAGRTAVWAGRVVLVDTPVAALGVTARAGQAALSGAGWVASSLAARTAALASAALSGATWAVQTTAEAASLMDG